MLKIKMPYFATRRRPRTPAARSNLSHAGRASSQLIISLVQLATCTCLLAALRCQSHLFQYEPASTNEIAQPRQPLKAATSNSSRHFPSREVTNLRLLPDLRAIKLRWTYEQPQLSGDENWPASFRIRYCELTSWQAEVKCRHRDLQVRAPLAGVAEGNSTTTSTQNKSSLWPLDEVNPMAGASIAQLDTAAPPPPPPSPLDNSTVISPNESKQELLLQQQQIDAASGEPAQRRQVTNAKNRTDGSADSPSAQPAAAAATGRTYEAQIYDLRALTSYTFDVQVLRFVGEQPADSPVAERPARPARRLDLASAESSRGFNQLATPGEHDTKAVGHRAETKAFSAEALRCLTNSSEVLVNTGRFFGGRISVEGQLATSGGGGGGPCQLVGNKSSAQSAYLFRIDHELCASRVSPDLQRIETMILVHENKDLLTHNTARFLVQCNIAQKSFTVRASVSLPRVNSLLPAATAATRNGGEPDGASPSQQNFRRATITALGNSPRNLEQVRLGSMPGVYRLIRAMQPQEDPQDQRSEFKRDQAPGQGVSGRRESKELQLQQQVVPGEGRRSAGAAALVQLPRPVDVSSGLLFVDSSSSQSHARSDDLLPLASATREARLLLPSSHERHHHNQRHQLVRAQPPVTTTASTRETTTIAQQQGQDRESDDLNGRQQQQQQQPVVVTNNHRVAGDFLPLEQAVARLERARFLAPGGELAESQHQASIRYSPAQVEEYSLSGVSARSPEGGDVGGTGTQVNPQAGATSTPGPSSQPAPPRSRSGRMRQIPGAQVVSGTTTTTTATTTTTITTPRPTTPDDLESRMGESRQSSGRKSSVTRSPSPPPPPPNNSIVNSSADVESDQSTSLAGNSSLGAIDGKLAGPTPVANSTLAQNITGALIRWSLKTLGNLARKSLDALAAEAELAASKRARVGQEEVEEEGAEREQPSGRSGAVAASPVTASKLLDGFVVESKAAKGAHLERTASTTKQPTSTSSSRQPQAAQAATQSADLEASRQAHVLEPPPSLSPQSTSTSASTTSAAPMLRQREQKARLEHQRSGRTREHAHRAKFRATGDESADLAPSPGGLTDGAHLGQERGEPAKEARSSSLWPIYCLWSLVGLVGLAGLTVFFFVSATRRRTTTTTGRRRGFEPSAHQRAHFMPHGVAAADAAGHPKWRLESNSIVAQMNEAINRHAQAPAEGGALAAALSPRALCYEHKQAERQLVVQSPSVQRHELGSRRAAELATGAPGTLAGQSAAQPYQAMTTAASNSLPHVISLSSGASDSGRSAASTRSTSAASTANLSTVGSASVAQHLGSVRLGDSPSGASGADSPSSQSAAPDHYRQPQQQQQQQHQESFCKNHEQFVYTDYLLLSDSDCLSNNCNVGRDSFA